MRIRSRSASSFIRIGIQITIVIKYTRKMFYKISYIQYRYLSYTNFWKFLEINKQSNNKIFYITLPTWFLLFVLPGYRSASSMRIQIQESPIMRIRNRDNNKILPENLIFPNIPTFSFIGNIFNFLRSNPDPPEKDGSRTSSRTAF